MRREMTKHIVGIGSKVDYNDRRWTVVGITKKQVELAEFKHGKAAGRTTRVDLAVFERLV